MLFSRRKRKEQKELYVFLNNRQITQVYSLKYLGIIFDPKLSFKDHINYMTEKCSKLIFALAKSAKLNWGLSHTALKTIYTGAILPLLQYGAPVWINAINNATYKTKLIRVQRLINIRIAKAYRTVSNEALPIITGLTPIYIKLEETALYYHHIKEGMKDEAIVDKDTTFQHWLHPSTTMTSLTNNNDDNSKIQIFTDGSKSKQGVGAGIAIYMSGTLIKNLRYRLDSTCTNNQAKQLAIMRSLEYIEKLQTAEKEATVYTDSQMMLDSLKNIKIHTSLIEKIRQKTIQLGQAAWKIKFGWVKDHAGTQGNEMADTLAKEAAADMDIAVSYNLITKA